METYGEWRYSSTILDMGEKSASGNGRFTSGEIEAYIH
jgi:hypothetical protein